MKTTRRGYVKAHRCKAGPGYLCARCGMEKNHRLHQPLLWRMTHDASEVVPVTTEKYKPHKFKRDHRGFPGQQGNYCTCGMYGNWRYHQSWWWRLWHRGERR